MATFTQTNRQLAVTTPLGKDVLLLAAFNGREEMSRLFHYELDLLSENVAVAAKDIVGKNVTFTMYRSEGTLRYFNGFVSRFSACNLRFRGMRQYRAEVVPWLWFLTRTADCRILQKRSTPEIIAQLFMDLGFTDYELNLTASYVKRDYCVQYRETDFNFVSRLMEEEGIFYWFRHENDKHTLVLGDAKSAYKDCAEKEVEYSPGSLVPNHVTDWEHQYEFRPGKYAQTDYNFETPSTSLMTNEPTTVQLPGNNKYEVYDYPGLYLKTGEGKPITKSHMEEEETPHDVVRGTSGCRTFSPGFKFTLKKHDCASEQGKSFVLTSIEHSAREGSYATGDEKDSAYSNIFTCVPSTITFRPARTTQKPTVKGTQTAVVVGPRGEEIYIDKYGRIKVQFHWDREGKKDENSSCWVRVAQSWAGKGWGIVFHPRIGQEVIVDFLEGDPDRPIVVGSVYNAEQMPPYELPAHQTRGAVKSRSSKNGGTENFNEIRFEDKKGSEQVFIDAERDMDLRVANDSREFVGKDRHLIVWSNQLEAVDGDKQAHVKGSHLEKIDKDLSHQVGGKRSEKVGTVYAIESGQEIHLKAGTKLIIEAGTLISLVCGSSFINIGPGGIAIKGTPVLINSGGAAGSGSGSSPQAPKAPDLADDGSKGGKLN